MRQLDKKFGVLLLAAALVAGVAACDKQEGPMEQAGKKVDRAAESTGQQVEKAGEKMQDAAKGEKKE